MPDAVERLAEAVRDAAARGARLAPRGAGHWWTEAAAGAAALDCTLTSGVCRIDAADLVATAGGGCALAALDAALAAQGVWLALDPPGPSQRTVGSALAAGGAGPLAAGFGPPRDQVLGMTFVAGNGTIAHTGGRVVKNVAGFDLAKLIVGSHGAFGVIAQAHLRLRARPAADLTRAWTLAQGPDVAVRRLMAAGAMPAAFEVVDPPLARALGLATQWTLLLRAMGTAEGVEEELEAAAAALLDCGAAPVSAPEDVWARWRLAVGAWPAILRIGADPDSWHAAAALAAALPLALGTSATVPRGTVRAGYERLPAETARALRSACRDRGWPVTLERADAATREVIGVWGAMDAGARRLAADLRRVFDPNGVFDVPLWADGPADR